MDTNRPPQSYQGTAPGFVWAIACILLCFVPFVIGFSDDVAVVYPHHSITLLMWCVGVGFGLLSMMIGLYFFRNAPARWVLATLMFLLGADAAASITWCVATRVELAHDFPRGQVQTTQVLAPIRVATRTTGGRGRIDRNVEMPGWPTLEVQPEDYTFMLRHRPANSGTTREKIVSDGYFCAILTTEQTHTAKRVIGLSSRKLPVNSVSWCPGHGPWHS